MFPLTLVFTALFACSPLATGDKRVNAERDLESTTDADTGAAVIDTETDTASPIDTETTDTEATDPVDTDTDVVIDPDDPDGDGYTDGDCDNNDPEIYPSAADTAGDGVDQNCDGVDGVDRDGDGYASEDTGGEDCNDNNPSWNPDAYDMFGDDSDQNCDGIDGIDADGDSFIDEDVGGNDCDDTDASIHPGAKDIPGDGIDQDCAFGDAEAAVEPAVTVVGWSCDEDGYQYDLKTSGVATGGTLYIYQTGSTSPWDEEHPVAVTTASGSGAWTELDLYLESVYPDVTDVVEGESTLYSCDDSGMQHTLTWVLEVHSATGDAVDCAVWGDDPAAITSAKGCTTF